MATSTTMRLPEGLKSEATAYADSLGLSLNALCAVALRDYLDSRKGARQAETTPPAVAQPVSPPQPDQGETWPLGAALSAALPPVKRNKNKRRKR